MSIVTSKSFRINLAFDALAAFVYSASGTLMTFENMKQIDYEGLALFSLLFNLFGIIGSWIGKNDKTWLILQKHWKTLFVLEFTLFPCVTAYTMITGDILTRWVLLGTIVSLTEVLAHQFWEHMKEVSQQGRQIQATQSMWHQAASTAGLFVTWLLANQWDWKPGLMEVFWAHILVCVLSTYSLLRLLKATGAIK